MIQICLMRHGHTAWNRLGRIQGRVDEPLDAQAVTHLSSLRLPPSSAGWPVVSSPLRRAVQTAELVAAPPTVTPELIEMDWGAWEGKRGVDLLGDPTSGYRDIEHWGWDFRPPGGESLRDVRARLLRWFASIDGNVVAVTHIGVMRVALAMATGWNFVGEPPFRVKRDRLYRITRRDSGALTFAGEPERLEARP